MDKTQKDNSRSSSQGQKEEQEGNQNLTVMPCTANSSIFLVLVEMNWSLFY